jgi:DNA-binding PucR family transcriptional regulator
MSGKSEQADQNIDLEAIAEKNNEGGASDSLKQSADDLRLHDAVVSKLRHRLLRLVGRVPDAPVSVSGHCREKGLALRTSAQAARDPRRQNQAASVSHDLWRLSCEMPGARLSIFMKKSLPP